MVILNQNNNVEQLFPIVEIFHSVQGEGYHVPGSHLFLLDLVDAISDAHGVTPILIFGQI